MELKVKKETTYTVRNIPMPLWTRMKILAAKKQMTVKDLLLELMKKEVEKENIMRMPA